MSFPFKIPFASSGDQSTVPDTDLTGSVNFTDGYTPDYQADPSLDPNAKLIERDKFNFLMNKVTGAVGEIQRQGSANWYSDLAPYDLNSEVFHNGKRWRSTIANNSATPDSGADWLDVTPGTAAARDVASPAEAIAGTAGPLLDAAGGHAAFGRYGVGTVAPGLTIADMNISFSQESRFFRWSSGTANAPWPVGEGVYIARSPGAFDGHRLLFGFEVNRAWLQARKQSTDEFLAAVELLTTGNTTVDPNGFIKAASPILSLYCDRIESNGDAALTDATFERAGTGHYVISGVPELSRDGWYIETPKDRNGNVYFTLDYEEGDGVLDIYTYTPDYSTGRAENGAPVDILAGRFVSLRFAEAEPEPDENAE